MSARLRVRSCGFALLRAACGVVPLAAQTQLEVVPYVGLYWPTSTLASEGGVRLQQRTSVIRGAPMTLWAGRLGIEGTVGYAPSGVWQPLDLQRAWVHLGARQIDLRADHDVLRTKGEDRFKHIRLVVEGGDLEMFDVRFTFGDGATFSPSTRFFFKGQSRSRVITLPGAARTIRWIDFFYRNPQGSVQGKATVHLYGRQ